MKLFFFQTIKKTRYPRWEETFDLEVTSYLGEDFLEVTMWDWDRMSNDDFMGRATLSLAELLPGQTVSDWVRLKPLDSSNDSRYVLWE